MANRKATFAKRQRETDLKDRAKQKEDRRSQKRGEVRDTKGPQIAWDEAVHAVTSDEPPAVRADLDGEGPDDADSADADSADDAPAAAYSASNSHPIAGAAAGKAG
jgi:hypothetical protein